MEEKMFFYHSKLWINQLFIIATKENLMKTMRARFKKYLKINMGWMLIMFNKDLSLILKEENIQFIFKINSNLLSQKLSTNILMFFSKFDLTFNHLYIFWIVTLKWEKYHCFFLKVTVVIFDLGLGWVDTFFWVSTFYLLLT